MAIKGENAVVKIESGSRLVVEREPWPDGLLSKEAQKIVSNVLDTQYVTLDVWPDGRFEVRKPCFWHEVWQRSFPQDGRILYTVEVEPICMGVTEKDILKAVGVLADIVNRLSAEKLIFGVGSGLSKTPMVRPLGWVICLMVYPTHNMKDKVREIVKPWASDGGALQRLYPEEFLPCPGCQKPTLVSKLSWTGRLTDLSLMCESCNDLPIEFNEAL